MKRYILPAIMMAAMLFLSSMPAATAVVIQKEIRVDVDFRNTTSFVLRNQNDGERSYVWAENTTPADDVWKFDVFIDANSSVVCPSNEDLIRRVQDDYTRMLETCRLSQEGWAQAGDLVNKFTECQTALSSCQVVRDDNINVLNARLPADEKNRADLQTCQLSLSTSQQAQQSLQLCNQQVSTLTAEKDELDKSKSSRGFIGFAIGAGLFFLLNKKKGGQQNMTPPDMRGGF